MTGWPSAGGHAAHHQELATQRHDGAKQAWPCHGGRRGVSLLRTPVASLREMNLLRSQSTMTMTERTISANSGKFGVFSAENVATIKKEISTAIDVSRHRGHDHCCYTFQILFFRSYDTERQWKNVLNGPYLCMSSCVPRIWFEVWTRFDCVG